MPNWFVSKLSFIGSKENIKKAIIDLLGEKPILSNYGAQLKDFRAHLELNKNEEKEFLIFEEDKTDTSNFTDDQKFIFALSKQEKFLDIKKLFDYYINDWEIPSGIKFNEVINGFYYNDNLLKATLKVNWTWSFTTAIRSTKFLCDERLKNINDDVILMLFRGIFILEEIALKNNISIMLYGEDKNMCFNEYLSIDRVRGWERYNSRALKEKGNCRAIHLFRNYKTDTINDTGCNCFENKWEYLKGMEGWGW